MAKNRNKPNDQERNAPSKSSEGSEAPRQGTSRNKPGESGTSKQGGTEGQTGTGRQNQANESDKAREAADLQSGEERSRTEPETTERSPRRGKGQHAQSGNEETEGFEQEQEL